jgi:hypothetical protein
MLISPYDAVMCMTVRPLPKSIKSMGTLLTVKGGREEDKVEDGESEEERDRDEERDGEREDEESEKEGEIRFDN